MSGGEFGLKAMVAAGFLAAIVLMIVPENTRAAEPGDTRNLLVEAQALSRFMQRMYPRESSAAVGVTESNGIVMPYMAEIEAASERFLIPKPLIAAVIKCESNWDRLARSPKGARGLMQILPRTASETFGVPSARLWNPAINIPVGTAYLRLLAQRYDGQTMDVLAAYNAGPTRVDTRSRLPRETRGFLTCVTRWYGHYARLLQ